VNTPTKVLFSGSEGGKKEEIIRVKVDEFDF
jgi:hypothetical protein